MSKTTGHRVHLNRTQSRALEDYILANHEAFKTSNLTVPAITEAALKHFSSTGNPLPITKGHIYTAYETLNLKVPFTRPTFNPSPSPLEDLPSPAPPPLLSTEDRDLLSSLTNQVKDLVTAIQLLTEALTPKP